MESVSLTKAGPIPAPSLLIAASNSRTACGARPTPKLELNFVFSMIRHSTEERASARQAGGIARSRKMVLPADLPAQEFANCTRVVDCLEKRSTKFVVENSISGSPTLSDTFQAFC